MSRHAIDVTGDDHETVEALRRDAARMLDALGLDTSELSVVLVEGDEIAALNETWRGKQGATDVLSFPQQEGAIRGGVLGDIVICTSVAAAQAVEVGHDLTTELRVLLAHGLAHLLGHDHHDSAQALAMSKVEARALAAAGLKQGLVGRSMAR